MFINICWKKNGEVKKTLVHISKLHPMVRELELQGVKTWFQTENP
jgi:hypothetical protein